VEEYYRFLNKPADFPWETHWRVVALTRGATPQPLEGRGDGRLSQFAPMAKCANGDLLCFELFIGRLFGATRHPLGGQGDHGQVRKRISPFGMRKLGQASGRFAGRGCCSSVPSAAHLWLIVRRYTQLHRLLHRICSA
jgi:hypothetical protein